jgi:hypothetical protein
MRMSGGASSAGDGEGSSPGTPASRRKGGAEHARTPLGALAHSPNVAPTPNDDQLHSPFFGQGSPGWQLSDGTPGLSDSVVSEQANYLVRERDDRAIASNKSTAHTLPPL